MSDDLIWDALKLVAHLASVLLLYPWWRPLPPKEKKP